MKGYRFKKKSNILIKISITILLFLVGYCVWTFLTAFYRYDNFSSNIRYKIAYLNLINTPQKIIDFANKKFTKFVFEVYSPKPRLILYVEPQNLEKINREVKKALKKKLLVSANKNYVPAKLKINNKEPMDVKIRLKGDVIDHISTKKNSFRIIPLKGRKPFGMSKFSIHKPEARGGIGEALLLAHLRDEDIIAPRYFFVSAHLNNNKYGAMALEEYFTKEMLEFNNRRESLIFSIDEDELWNQRVINIKNNDANLKNPDPLFSHPYDCRTNFTTTYELLNANFFKSYGSEKVKNLLEKEALGLLRGYSYGYIKAEDVFDMDKLGKYLAILNLWTGYHGQAFNNLKFYYNPITRLFEPIGYDNNISFTDLKRLKYKVHINPLFHAKSSSEFLKSYKENILRFKEEIYSGEFKEKTDNWRKSFFKILIMDRRIRNTIPKEFFKQKIDFLANNLPQQSSSKYYMPTKEETMLHSQITENFETIQYLNVFLIEENGEKYLEFQNLIDRNVIVKDIFLEKNGIKFQSLKDEETIIPPYLTYQDFIRIKITQNIPKNSLVTISAGYKHLNKDEFFYQSEIEALNYHKASLKAKYRPMELGEFVQKFSFVKYENNKLIIKSGTYFVNDDMIFPKFIPIEIRAGAKLLFAENTRMVVRSPLLIDGILGDEPIATKYLFNR
ncbi:MAG: hypothetical protein PHV68_06460 [Candidatus Gastranaerophilales bacterium]|nr:hypothetical protein [Candidatus Gastranaerophilales bacterium]